MNLVMSLHRQRVRRNQMDREPETDGHQSNITIIRLPQRRIKAIHYIVVKILNKPDNLLAMALDSQSFDQHPCFSLREIYLDCRIPSKPIKRLHSGLICSLAG